MKAGLIAGLVVALAAPALAAPGGSGGPPPAPHMGALGPGSLPIPPHGSQSQRAAAQGTVAPPPAKPSAPTGQAKLSQPTDPIVARYSAQYEGCMHKAVSTLEMLDCGARETDRWDGRLNRAYQARMNSLNDRQRGALKRAEKAWLIFREADCAAYEDEEWGSISKIDSSQCVLRRTVERALELESFPADHGPG